MTQKETPPTTPSSEKTQPTNLKPVIGLALSLVALGASFELQNYFIREYNAKLDILDWTILISFLSTIAHSLFFLSRISKNTDEFYTRRKKQAEIAEEKKVVKETLEELAERLLTLKKSDKRK